MSRTFRRKRGTYHYSWVLREWKLVEPSIGYFFFQKVWYDGNSREGRSRLARYHSDAGFGDYSHKAAPHWYRRHCNKKFAHCEQRLVHRCARGEAEDVIAPRRVRNASWYWWYES